MAQYSLPRGIAAIKRWSWQNYGRVGDSRMWDADDDLFCAYYT